MKISLVSPGWAVGIILFFVDLLLLMVAISVMARLPMFEGGNEAPLLWWPDWRVAGYVTLAGFLPAIIAGCVAGYRDVVREPMVWGLASLLGVWLIFSPFIFGNGVALTPSGEIIVRENAPYYEEARWPASFTKITLGCQERSDSRQRLFQRPRAPYLPVYEIKLPTHRTLNLDGFKQGNHASAIDEWISTLALADHVLKANGAEKVYDSGQASCIAGLFAQSQNSEGLLRLYARNFFKLNNQAAIR